MGGGPFEDAGEVPSHWSRWRHFRRDEGEKDDERDGDPMRRLGSYTNVIYDVNQKVI